MKLRAYCCLLIQKRIGACFFLYRFIYSILLFETKQQMKISAVLSSENK